MAVVPDVMRVSDLPVAFVKPVTVGTVVGCIVFVPVTFVRPVAEMVLRDSAVKTVAETVAKDPVALVSVTLFIPVAGVVVSCSTIFVETVVSVWFITDWVCIEILVFKEDIVVRVWFTGSCVWSEAVVFSVVIVVSVWFMGDCV